MKKYFLILLMLLTLFPSSTWAQRMYIVDTFKIMVRREPGEEYRIVKQLPSDMRVNLIAIEGDWAKISFGNETGWVLKRYLTEETPKAIQITELERKVQSQTVKIEALEKDNLSLKEKNADMAQVIATRAEEVKDLSLENQRLKEEPQRLIMLLSGAGVFLFGCIMTLILQRTGRGRKRNRLSFE